MSNVKNDQGLVDVHFQITTGAAKAHSHIIGHHLHGDHGQRLALAWAATASPLAFVDTIFCSQVAGLSATKLPKCTESTTLDLTTPTKPSATSTALNSLRSQRYVLRR